MKKIQNPKRQTKLQKLIAQYMPELEEAQRRVKALKGKDTPALRAAQKSKSKSRGKFGRIFTFSDIKTQKQLNREIVRIRTFLSNETSKRESLPKRRTPFQSWEDYNIPNKKGSKNDERYKKETYEAYRRLQERFGGEERFKAIMDANRTSKSKYDSDNTLEMIEDDFSQGMSMEDILTKWEEIFDEMESSYMSFKNNEE